MLDPKQEDQLAQTFREAEREIPLSLRMKLDAIPETHQPFEKLYWILNGFGAVIFAIFIFIYRGILVDKMMGLNSILTIWIKLIADSPLGLFGVPLILTTFVILIYCVYRTKRTSFSM